MKVVERPMFHDQEAISTSPKRLMTFTKPSSFSDPFLTLDISCVVCFAAPALSLPRSCGSLFPSITILSLRVVVVFVVACCIPAQNLFHFPYSLAVVQQMRKDAMQLRRRSQLF